MYVTLAVLISKVRIFLLDRKAEVFPVETLRKLARSNMAVFGLYFMRRREGGREIEVVYLDINSRVRQRDSQRLAVAVGALPRTDTPMWLTAKDLFRDRRVYPQEVQRVMPNADFYVADPRGRTVVYRWRDNKFVDSKSVRLSF